MHAAELANTLFYSFSTISQSLAVAIGLLALFLAYRLAEIDRLLRSHLEHLYRLQPGRSENFHEVHFLWADFDVPGLLEFFGKDPPESLEFGDGLDRPVHLSPARALHAKRQELVTGMRRCFQWTAVAIVGALIVLAITPLLAAAGWYVGGPVLALGVLIVVWCLHLYHALLKGALIEKQAEG